MVTSLLVHAGGKVGLQVQDGIVDLNELPVSLQRQWGAGTEELPQARGPWLGQ